MNDKEKYERCRELSKKYMCESCDNCEYNMPIDVYLSFYDKDDKEFEDGKI